jgi:hypothetical protein
VRVADADERAGFVRTAMSKAEPSIGSVPATVALSGVRPLAVVS